MQLRVAEIREKERARIHTPWREREREPTLCCQNLPQSRNKQECGPLAERGIHQ